LEVGETPAAGVAREAREETGIPCEAVALVGIHDSRLAGTVTAHHLYHLLFLCRPLTTTAGPASHAVEVLESGWFAENALPTDLDPGHASRIPEAFRVWHGDERASFDEVYDA
jgi:ADP-ribose pyrophosphatase YjhB (NUDIX family)